MGRREGEEVVVYSNGGVVCDGIVKVPQRRMGRGHNFELLQAFLPL